MPKICDNKAIEVTLKRRDGRIIYRKTINTFTTADVNLHHLDICHSTNGRPFSILFVTLIQTNAHRHLYTLCTVYINTMNSNSINVINIHISNTKKYITILLNNRAVQELRP